MEQKRAGKLGRPEQLKVNRQSTREKAAHRGCWVALWRVPLEASEYRKQGRELPKTQERNHPKDWNKSSPGFTWPRTLSVPTNRNEDSLLIRGQVEDFSLAN